jgi:hypothetical protein
MCAHWLRIKRSALSGAAKYEKPEQSKNDDNYEPIGLLSPPTMPDPIVLCDRRGYTRSLRHRRLLPFHSILYFSG